MYQKLKKQNGEKFAQTIRNFHNGILEIENIDSILHHAGDDAEPLLPYLMSLLTSNNDQPSVTSQDPFTLLNQAGYDAFYADTLEKQNSIKKYFKQGELLCTFNDAARYKNYHIIHAVKKDVAEIKREDFTGKEEREDAYGTSVVSIQMLKRGGFISIKNRYNHAVSGSDNTFNSCPDNIIKGLSAALKESFNVEFTATKVALPEGYVLIKNQIFKYNQEIKNIYYGDNAWIKNGTIHTVDKSAGDALFDYFLFDNKTKTLKNVDPEYKDSFADDFNKAYGGNKALKVKNGNLILNGETLITAENSRIKKICLPELTEMGLDCLLHPSALTHFEAPNLKNMGNHCFYNPKTLTHFKAPNLMHMGSSCLYFADALTCFEAGNLITMGAECLYDSRSLNKFVAPNLTHMRNSCLYSAKALTCFEAGNLITMDAECLYNVNALTLLEIPSLKHIGDNCFRYAHSLSRIEAPSLTQMGERCFTDAKSLEYVDAPILSIVGADCFKNTKNIKYFNAPMYRRQPHYVQETLSKTQRSTKQVSFAECAVSM